MDSSVLESFYNFLKLKKLVKSKEDLAKKLGFTRQYVTGVLNGSINVSKSFIEKMIWSYKTELNEYFQTHALWENDSQSQALAEVIEDLNMQGSYRMLTEIPSSANKQVELDSTLARISHLNDLLEAKDKMIGYLESSLDRLVDINKMQGQRITELEKMIKTFNLIAQNEGEWPENITNFLRDSIMQAIEEKYNPKAKPEE